VIGSFSVVGTFLSDPFFFSDAQIQVYPSVMQMEISDLKRQMAARQVQRIVLFSIVKELEIYLKVISTE
jgi:hypothetical protein